MSKPTCCELKTYQITTVHSVALQTAFEMTRHGFESHLEKVVRWHDLSRRKRDIYAIANVI